MKIDRGVSEMRGIENQVKVPWLIQKLVLPYMP